MKLRERSSKLIRLLNTLNWSLKSLKEIEESIKSIIPDAEFEYISPTQMKSYWAPLSKGLYVLFTEGSDTLEYIGNRDTPIHEEYVE